MKKLVVLFATFFFLVQFGFAQTRTSVQNGNYNVAASWDCNCIPGSTDTLNVSHTITLTSGRTMGEVRVTPTGRLNVDNGNSTISNTLNIENGGIVSNNSRLDVFGDYILNGTNQGSGRVRLRGSNTEIDGTGNLNNTNRIIINGGDKTILSTADITVVDRLQLNNTVTVINNGSVDCNRITGNASRTWVNSTNASLTVGNNIGANLVLRADSAGNTVTYNRTGTGNVTLNNPVNSTYYNLVIDGDNTASRKRLASNTIVLNDLTIEGSTFDVRSSSTNFDLDVEGDWVRNGGVFNERDGIVRFDGGQDQTIDATTTETFHDVTFAGTGTKLLSTNLDVGNALVVDANSTLDVNSTTNQSLNVEGDFTVNGTLEARDGVVVLDGNALQNVSGVVTFNDMTINNASGVNLSTDAQALRGILTLTNGNIATANTLTLVSDQNGTASIAEITGGSISGDITMQRYVNAGSTGWRFLTSAVSGRTLADWNDDFITTGFTNSDFPTFPFISLYTYDETALGAFTNGYTAPADISDAIAVGEGFWAWSGDTITGTQPFTIDVTGPANTGVINLPVSYTDDLSQPATQDGWNMVGNPYPAAINWDDANWTKTNVNNAIYIWNPDAQQYASYVGGVGTNGGTASIASSQAFWVQTNGNAPALTAREGVKVSSDPAFLRSKRIAGNLKISIDNGLYSDETLILVNGEATNGFDGAYDAAKLYSSNTAVPGIATLNGTEEFSINTIAGVDNDLTIPVRLKVNVSGDHDFYFTNTIQDPTVSCVIIEDLVTGAFIQAGGKVYRTFVSDTATTPRFLIHMGASPVQAIGHLSCYETKDGSIEVTGQGTGPWDYTIKDEADKLIKEVKNAQSQIIVEGLPAGNYTVETTNSGICGDVSQTVEVEQPAEVVAHFEIATPVEQYFGINQLVNFKNFSKNATEYHWSFGDGETSLKSEPIHRYAQAGIYSIRMTAIEGDCEAISEGVVIVKESQQTVAVNELEDENQLNIYSTGSTIYLQLNRENPADLQVTVTSLLGQELYKKQYTGSQQLNETFNMQVATGVYLVNVQIEGKVFTQKVALLN